jgi:pimeloyl-ACP methyl ester carboxylesterase
MTLPLAIDSRGAGGLPVIFAHSFAGDLSHWNSTLEHLKPQRRVIAFDFSGHGSSPSGTGHWIHLDKPDEFNKTLDRILKAI